MSRTTFDYIVEQLRPSLTKMDTKMRKAIPVDKRCAIAIHCLKSGADYETIAQAYGVGVSTVCTILKDFCQATREILAPIHVRMPTDETDLEEIVDGFEQRWNFPGCVGALDSTHVPIKSPEEFPEDYYNYKGWKSIHCLAPVDHLYRFRYVHIGAAGRNNDGSVFQKSSLSKIETIEKICPTTKNFHIIADGAFKLMRWMMKPFPEFKGVTDMQRNFNFRLSRDRMVVECAYGRLKARFGILQKRCDQKIEDVPSIVYACVILHNLCENMGDNVQLSWVRRMAENENRENHPPEQPVPEVADHSANEKRSKLAHQLFNDNFQQTRLNRLDRAIIGVPE